MVEFGCKLLYMSVKARLFYSQNFPNVIVIGRDSLIKVRKEKTIMLFLARWNTRIDEI